MKKVPIARALRQRLALASDETEINRLMNLGSKFKYVSKKTKDRWLRIASKRLDYLLAKKRSNHMPQEATIKLNKDQVETVLSALIDQSAFIQLSHEHATHANDVVDVGYWNVRKAQNKELNDIFHKHLAEMNDSGNRD